MAIQAGSNGPLVRSWQQFLVDEGLLAAAALTAADGRFDSATSAATQDFQRRAGLVPDGIVGPRTFELAREAGYAGVVLAADYTLLYGLRSAAVDDWDHPAALVHAPPGFDPGELAVCVYLHGLENNIANVVAAEAASAAFPVADLLGQLARCRRNVLLVVPELHYNATQGGPGRLGEPGALRALLTEIFAKPLPGLPGLSIDALMRLVLIAHSAGYRAAGTMALGGGLRVDELYLLDALYGMEDEFAEFLDAVLTELGQGRSAGRRLVSLYTAGSRPAELSRALAQRAAAKAAALPAGSIIISDEPLDPDALPEGARVLIQRVAVGHSEIPRRFVGALLQQSGLPMRQG